MPRSGRGKYHALRAGNAGAEDGAGGGKSRK
jgi:hypothetical protein